MTSGKNERNEKMFEAVIRGGTFAAIAESEGVTTERARQVVHKMRRMMMHPKRLGTSVVPDADFYKVSELRKHASFWLEQLAKWRAEHGFSDRVDGATEPAASTLMGKRQAP